MYDVAFSNTHVEPGDDGAGGGGNKGDSLKSTFFVCMENLSNNSTVNAELSAALFMKFEIVFVPHSELELPRQSTVSTAFSSEYVQSAAPSHNPVDSSLHVLFCNEDGIVI